MTWSIVGDTIVSFGAASGGFGAGSGGRAGRSISANAGVALAHKAAATIQVVWVMPPSARPAARFASKRLARARSVARPRRAPPGAPEPPGIARARAPHPGARTPRPSPG